MDLAIKESGNGGEFVKKKNDLLIIEGFQNMPYLALFGGNLGQKTPKDRQERVQMFDFWANSLLFDQNSAAQFNSLTEFALMTYPLTSFGLSQIRQAVTADLDFMRSFSEIKVDVILESDDRLSILINVNEVGNEQNKQFLFIWDSTLKELVDIENQGALIVPLLGIFDQTFDFTYN